LGVLRNCGVSGLEAATSTPGGSIMRAVEAVWEAVIEQESSSGVGVSAMEGCRSGGSVLLLLAKEVSESVSEAVEMASDLSAGVDLEGVDLEPLD